MIQNRLSILLIVLSGQNAAVHFAAKASIPPVNYPPGLQLQYLQSISSLPYPFVNYFPHLLPRTAVQEQKERSTGQKYEKLSPTAAAAAAVEGKYGRSHEREMAEELYQCILELMKLYRILMGDAGHTVKTTTIVNKERSAEEFREEYSKKKMESPIVVKVKYPAPKPGGKFLPSSYHHQSNHGNNDLDVRASIQVSNDQIQYGSSKPSPPKTRSPITVSAYTVPMRMYMDGTRTYGAGYKDMRKMHGQMPPWWWQRRTK